MPSRTVALAPALAFAVAVVALGLPRTARADPPARAAARTRTALSRALPPLDGNHLHATLVEVTFAPGQVSPPHSHACPVMVYVLEGAIRSRVRGGPEATYRAGDSFDEPPGGVHEFSANASDQVPARFLAIFVCDRDVPLTTALPTTPGGK
jgi:quercetin dioxygenase-like cupin family protein